MVVLFHEVNLTLSFGVEWIQVVEIIAQNLENESSLHKKVDLFFLVDSIAQFSRGLKGNYMSIFCFVALHLYASFLPGRLLFPACICNCRSHWWHISFRNSGSIATSSSSNCSSWK